MNIQDYKYIPTHNPWFEPRVTPLKPFDEEHYEGQTYTATTITYPNTHWCILSEGDCKIVKLLAAGVSKENIEANFHQGILIVNIKGSPPQGLSFGSPIYRIQVGEGYKYEKAELEDGILTVRFKVKSGDGPVKIEL